MRDRGDVKEQGATLQQPGAGGLSLQEAQRAIYLDYEASVNRPPTLLGVRIEKETKVWVLEPEFHCCVGRNQTPRTVAGSHTPVATEIVDQAEREDRLIVSWSAHDFRLMDAAFTHDTKRRDILIARYRDAKKSGRRWMRLQSPRWREQAKEQGHTLELYRRRFGIHQPAHFGAGIAGAAIRLVRAQLDDRRTYATLTPKAKESWRALVRHNEFDLTSLQQVALKVTE